MERNGMEVVVGDARKRRRRARFIFQVQTRDGGTVLRVLDTCSDRVFREIPIQEFLEYARTHKDVTTFLLSKLSEEEPPDE